MDEVVDEGQALTSALAIAEQFASAAPLSVAVTKAVYADGCLTLDDAFRAELRGGSAPRADRATVPGAGR